jgi:hypothetical protein
MPTLGIIVAMREELEIVLERLQEPRPSSVPAWTFIAAAIWVNLWWP